MAKFFLNELPSILLIIVMFVIGVSVYPYLPEQVPSHWNIKGEVDGYSGPFAGAFLMPLITLGVYILLLVVPYLDPRKDNYFKFEKIYGRFKFGLVLFFTLLYAAIMLFVFGYISDLTGVIFTLLAILFIFLGNYLGKIRQNYFLGLKFPWTLADEEIWNKTHRLGGRVWVISGLIGLFSIILLGKPYAYYAFFGVLAVSTIITVVYSYLIYKRKNF